MLKTESTTPPKLDSIGRFEISQVLGRGAQGVVYQAQDPQLGRTVAIKTLANHSGDANALLAEARHLSRLSHPHLASVFDMGNHHDNVYIVYEYIEGRSLRSLLSEHRRELGEVLRWMSQTLDAVAHAHAQGIVHRDLNPNNIRIDKLGNAKVLDFGIATTAGTPTTARADMVGTVNYMAPEVIANGVIGPEVDVFALGLLLFEMLTGRQAISAPSSMAALFKISNECIPLPTDIDASIDPRFNEIIATALAKEPQLRYPTAGIMAQALGAVTLNSQQVASNTNQSTLGFLLRRMRRKADFPALSARICAINRQIDDDKHHSVNDLANVVLKDYALTTKLLKLVNSSFYGQYGGHISTVSRAIVILGFKQIRAIAQSLMLFENLEDKPHTNRLRENASHAVLSGIIARLMVADEKSIDIDPEEVFICGMVHTLGKHLTMYYLPEEYTEIETHQAHTQVPEAQSCIEILGVTYETLGSGVASEWGLPKFIISSMTPPPPGPVRATSDPLTHCQNVSAFANQLCDALTADEFDTNTLDALQRRFHGALRVDTDRLAVIVNETLRAAKELGPIVTDNFASSQIFQAIAAWTADPDPVVTHTARAAPQDHKTNEDDSDTVLNGIQDISNALIENCSINDILSMILETIYRGLNFTRVVLCIADQKQGTMGARCGLGDNVDVLIQQFRFPLASASDPFSVALQRRTHIVFPKSGLTSTDLPTWYRRMVNPKLMLLLPILVGQRCPGAIYCDVLDEAAQFSAKQFNYLVTLRNQAALAIKQQ